MHIHAGGRIPVGIKEDHAIGAGQIDAEATHTADVIDSGVMGAGTGSSAGTRRLMRRY